MLEIQLILCPIDFSGFSASAYHHALSLAEHYRARLVALHVVELRRDPSLGFAASAGLYEEFCQAALESAREQLRKFVKQHAHHEIQPELVTQLGAAPDAILSFAQARKTDLVVMGTHGRRGYDRLILGSVTDRVMRKAPCPVIAVSKPPNGSSAESQDRGHTHHLSRILFCADFSEAARRTLDYAISVRAEYDAELTLLHVLEHVPSPARTEEAIAAAKEQLGSLIPSEERQTAKIKTAVRLGKPYRQIIQLALEEQIDLVAMGVRGHGALDLAVFGSTTYRVIQLGPCPVLVHV
jgi:nucleotide-binding universal stress UspA family protein